MTVCVLECSDPVVPSASVHVSSIPLAMVQPTMQRVGKLVRSIHVQRSEQDIIAGRPTLRDLPLAVVINNEEQLTIGSSICLVIRVEGVLAACITMKDLTGAVVVTKIEVMPSSGSRKSVCPSAPV